MAGKVTSSRGSMPCTNFLRWRKPPNCANSDRSLNTLNVRKHPSQPRRRRIQRVARPVEIQWRAESPERREKPRGDFRVRCERVRFSALKIGLSALSTPLSTLNSQLNSYGSEMKHFAAGHDLLLRLVEGHAFARACRRIRHDRGGRMLVTRFHRRVRLLT